jgi:hypothetical protein
VPKLMDAPAWRLRRKESELAPSPSIHARCRAARRHNMNQIPPPHTHGEIPAGTLWRLAVGSKLHCRTCTKRSLLPSSLLGLCTAGSLETARRENSGGVGLRLATQSSRAASGGRVEVSKSLHCDVK